MTVGIKERLAVRAVIEKKGLIVAALAEVTAQKRQNAVFRFDLRGEHAADVGKAHEAAVLLQLAVQLPHSAQQGMVRFIGKALQQHLERAGYKSYLIAATHTYNEADMKSMWSHRSAAVAAGLGEFGANRMVITPKGSAGRFCSVITEAPLEPTHSDGVERCGYLRNGSCGLCFKVCPVGALQPGSINRKACQAETRKNEKLLAEREGILGADTCGRCISVCPAAYIE